MGLWSGFDVLVDLRLMDFLGVRFLGGGLKRSIKIAHASFDPRLSMVHGL